MNLIYLGKPRSLNIGNGKTVSAIGNAINTYLDDDRRTIFSNICLKEVEYTPFTPDTLGSVLKTSNAIVILDELHAIVHKNHKVNAACKKHGDHIGLCYRLAEFFRQTRKRNILTISTCQTYMDAQKQLRDLMQEQIECSKHNLYNSRLYKCDSDNCPEEHRHFIKQDLYRGDYYIKELPIFDPEPYYGCYDSFEIVEGWVTYD